MKVFLKASFKAIDVSADSALKPTVNIAAVIRALPELEKNFRKFMVGGNVLPFDLDECPSKEQTQTHSAYHQNQGPELVRTMVYRSSVSSHGLVAGTVKPAGGEMNF